MTSYLVVLRRNDSWICRCVGDWGGTWYRRCSKLQFFLLSCRKT